MLRYRMLLAVTPAGAERFIDHAQRSWATWMAYKRLVPHESALAATLATGMARLDDGSTMTHSIASDGSHRWRLIESRESGRWTSTLTCVSPNELVRAGEGIGGWTEFTIDSSAEEEGDDSEATEDALPRFALPRLATYLLNDFTWSDSRATIGVLHDVDRNRVPNLASVLTGAQRRLPALVFSPPPIGARGGWEEAVQTVSEAVNGYATVWRLAPDTTNPLIARLGRDLSVWGGAVRTYMPRVRAHDPEEAGWTTRHRVLSWDRLREDPRRAAALLAHQARVALLDAAPWTSPPQQLNEVSIRITEVPSLVLRSDSRASEGAAAFEALKDDLAASAALELRLREENAALIEQAQTALALASLAEEEKLQALAEAAATANDNVSTLEDLERANGQVRSLGFALASAHLRDGDAPIEMATDPGEQYPRPDSFADLLMLLPDIPELSFTGNSRSMLALDRHSNRRAWITKAWEAALSMVEYVRAVSAGSYTGLFAQWCESGAPPGARTLPVGSGKAVVPGESDTVKNDRTMSAERLLPVPTSVDPDGRVYMWQHVRIGGGGDAPRMHYTEHGAHIYIGYIGRHLTNTLT